MSTKPCLLCAKNPRSDGKLCDGCWKVVNANAAWLDGLPGRVVKATRAFWSEVLRGQ